MLASRFRLAGPVVAGERVAVGGRVTAVGPGGSASSGEGDSTAVRVACDVWLDVERAEGVVRVLTGTAVVAFGPSLASGAEP